MGRWSSAQEAEAAHREMRHSTLHACSCICSTSACRLLMGYRNNRCCNAHPLGARNPPNTPD